jgi:hypothetical protein
MCAEPIKADASKCPSCGEALVDGKAAPKKSGLPLVAILAVCAVGLCGFVAVIAAIAIPNLIEARKHGNEAAAIGALKTINTAQALFRESDREADGLLDYGSLTELSDATFVDPVLGGGQKQGYMFQSVASPTTPEFLWMATATPMTPGKTGDRYFVTNHAGVIYYSNDAPFSITPDCEIPPNAVPVGR